MSHKADYDEVKHAEMIERAAFELVVQAISDYLHRAKKIFLEEEDLAQDIAEDVTREALESMGMPSFPERLYGKVDFKQAMYVFIPDAHPVALMLDAKAEKANGSATIQKSQTSMKIMYKDRHGRDVREEGGLSRVIKRRGRRLYVVSIVAKYVYSELPSGGYRLDEVVLACIPNGLLQDKYNPNPESTIWRVGRHAPTRGEEFRVRLSFSKLQQRESWRVKRLKPNDKE